ncbi:MAG: APC family permease [Cyanobacteria bacterium HKST-UBA01]|nr:APC family permease [Cyanobacteria bacterium HKST-UBA01]
MAEAENNSKNKSIDEHRAPWWQVMCLTGVDYFSTLGYQPGIAILAAGQISPQATLVLIAVTLFCALPAYFVVARESPHGQGSVQMLERQFKGWKSKSMVLILLGFVITAFIFTITLSTADATAHILENPILFSEPNHALRVPITILLIMSLTAVFFRGFKEAIKIAVAVVAIYLALNLVVIGSSAMQIFQDPNQFTDWLNRANHNYPSPILLLGAALIVFPKLALGLSGFETGVAVMPLVEGKNTDSEECPRGRIENTRKLLLSAALIMSVFLIGSSFVTTISIPESLLQEGAAANGRALAYLAHQNLGSIFGTVYDLVTITILWFAGASAFTGLLTIIPQYLPRYGMAPDWTALRIPLALIIGAFSIIITIIFGANVDVQAGPYATGILIMITSAAIAAYLSIPKEAVAKKLYFLFVSTVFAYTSIANMIQQVDGLLISLAVVAIILVGSFIYRSIRSTELRIKSVKLDDNSMRFIKEATKGHWGEIRILAHKPNDSDYEGKEEDARYIHSIQTKEGKFIFLEVETDDTSEFIDDEMDVHGLMIDGYRVLRCKSHSVSNALAAVLLEIRNRTGKVPHVYLRWTEGHPIAYALKFVFFGEGETASLTREILRSAEWDDSRRPIVHAA